MATKRKRKTTAVKPEDILPKETPKSSAKPKPVVVPPAPEVVPPPPLDISVYMEKINNRLSATWATNEIRCGRSIELPSDTSVNIVNRICEEYSKWNPKISRHPRSGVVYISFRLPNASAAGRMSQ